MLNMSTQYEDGFMSESLLSKPVFIYNDAQSTIEVILSSSTTQTRQDPQEIISLGIPDNEAIDDAERDMDKLTQNALKDWN